MTLWLPMQAQPGNYLVAGGGGVQGKCSSVAIITVCMHSSHVNMRKRSALIRCLYCNTTSILPSFCIIWLSTISVHASSIHPVWCPSCDSEDHHLVAH